jgi:hypothetical protein
MEVSCVFFLNLCKQLNEFVCNQNDAGSIPALDIVTKSSSPMIPAPMIPTWIEISNVMKQG